MLSSSSESHVNCRSPRLSTPQPVLSEKVAAAFLICAALMTGNGALVSHMLLPSPSLHGAVCQLTSLSQISFHALYSSSTISAAAAVCAPSRLVPVSGASFSLLAHLCRAPPPSFRLFATHPAHPCRLPLTWAQLLFYITRSTHSHVASRKVTASLGLCLKLLNKAAMRLHLSSFASVKVNGGPFDLTFDMRRCHYICRP